MILSRNGQHNQNEASGTVVPCDYPQSDQCSSNGYEKRISFFDHYIVMRELPC